MDTILRINNLFAGYGKECVLNDISFEVEAGKKVCIVGESGSGKSTLLKSIHGFAGVSVTGGSIEIERNILLGIVPQNPGGSFNPIRTYKAQIGEALKSNNIDFKIEEVEKTLQTLGLSDAKRALRARPYELSGGMNQRMAIATTMLLEPGILLCDEVTSALDVKTAGIVVEQLLEINRLRKTTILMVTHHLGIASKMADYIGIMKSGKMLEYGPAKEILDNPQNEYTKNLLKALPRLKVN
ncbi:ATP-binding cassette domain-containing protein [Butyrivibrio sp. NC2002]|uniref:ATP-binding cassette domain-containing protein n=1 Tax=Butyrivibrio sp. NC2002 TaxID=1410610 RepID=UPI00068D4CC5|nr:ABC transporter ATP-binding protein [Butyrivibrio sp. NC2002]